jgi:magnesium chelatase subunit D
VTSLARFPFSAVVGQDEARMALLLAAVDPGIGGVLLRGDKGSAKSTLARGLAGMLPGGAPFVELPLGATEDRVLGTIDLKAALTEGDTVFRPGLLAAAHGGVLYVDEVNLLPDHLVDVLLDVAGSGINVVERDGVSHSHPARFVLVGSMNPEEGELRPQLLDRFGLSVEIKAPADPRARAEVVRRRLTHDAGGRVDGGEGDIVLRARLAASMPADLPDTVVDFACRLAVSVGAEGLRADLVLCRAAAAFAGWEGRSVASSSDVERVAGMALGHRRRRRPFDPPTLNAGELERALDAARQSFAAAHRAPQPAPVPEPVDESILEGLLDDEDATPAPEPPPTGEADAAAAAGDEVRWPEATPVEVEAAIEDELEAEDEALAAAAPAGDAPGGDAPADPFAEAEARADVDEAAEPVPAPGEASGPPDGPAGSPPPPPPPPSGWVPAGGPTPPPGSPWESLAGKAFNAPPPPPPTLDEPPASAPPPPPPPGGGEARMGRSAAGTEPRGRVIGHQAPAGASMAGVAVAATVRAAAQRRQADPGGPALAVEDLREPVRTRTTGRTVVVAVDASGSMGTHQRVEAATGAVLGLLADAYLRRDRVAMVTFRGDSAEVVLPPTASVELARTRLAELPTGGVTPLAEGIDAALSIARRAAGDGWPPLLVLITDGRATGHQAAGERARAAAADVAAAGFDVVVIDAEDGPSRLGLAEQLAATMGARHLRLEEMAPQRLEAAVRDALVR